MERKERSIRVLASARTDILKLEDVLLCLAHAMDGLDGSLVELRGIRGALFYKVVELRGVSYELSTLVDRLNAIKETTGGDE